MALRDLDDILVPKPIQLPVHGRLHDFPRDVPARAVVLLHRMRSTALQARKQIVSGEMDAERLAALVLDDSEQVDLFDDLLGKGRRQRLVDEGWTDAQIDHVYGTLCVWHMFGQDAGEAFWETPLGEAGARPPGKASRASSAGASRTRSPASTAATTGSPKRPARAARRGTTSTSPATGA